MQAAPLNFDAARTLSADEVALVGRARETAYILYEGVRVAHRSCGIALAETFALPTRPYQALRKGGITGAGECGAIKAGELVLGELLGDPDPRGAPTANLIAAVRWYQAAWHARIDLGHGKGNGQPNPSDIDIACNALTRRFPDFASPARRRFCTNIAAEVAALVSEALLRAGVPPTVAPVPAS